MPYKSNAPNNLPPSRPPPSASVLFFSICRTCSTESDPSCQSAEPVNLELQVISTQPKALQIPNLLSDVEADQIIRLASPKMRLSAVGYTGHGPGPQQHAHRTSTVSWIQRNSSRITESIFLRVADLLGIDERRLRKNASMEDLQVVHYAPGQKYDIHHDWGVCRYPDTRFLTLLLYLNDLPNPQAGGETAFPKGAGGLGFKVQPKKGSAVLFYNLLEDGNGDDLALHASLPVLEGEKWLANFWVWDPKLNTEPCLL
jgi:prolyl 4-hydroxylase